jgi:hypothetical protein
VAFDDVFAELKQVLSAHAPELVVTVDVPGNYQLDAPRPIDPKKPPSAYFGGVRVGKSYVTYHLMPVYVEPALLESVSPRLKKRMQGKSCFNFTKLDPEAKRELADLTRRGVEAYRARGLL